MTVSEYGSISLRVAGQEINTFKEYSFNNHFLTPTDGFSFTIGDEVLNPILWGLLVPGRKVQLLVNGALQATGYIDSVDTAGDRTSGNCIVVEGRDVFSPVVDSEIDPRKRYPDKTNLQTLLQDNLEQFGFDTFFLDNESNSDIQAGRALPRAKHAAKASKKPRKVALSQYPMPKSKPHHGETFYQFLARCTQRLGLWIWPTVDGQGIVVSQPDFDQAPRYTLRRKIGQQSTNILAGGIRRDSTDQPSYIVATNTIPPRIYEHSTGRVIIDNPYTRVINPDGSVSTGQTNASLNTGVEIGTFIEAAVRLRKEVVAISVPSPPVKIQNSFASTIARPKYVKDTESHTKEAIERFVTRQMSLYLRRAVVGTYEFEGHEIDGHVVTIDSVVNIDDDRSNWHEPMWIMNRTLMKSRSGGTRTRIECIPLHTLTF